MEETGEFKLTIIGIIMNLRMENRILSLIKICWVLIILIFSSGCIKEVKKHNLNVDDWIKLDKLNTKLNTVDHNSMRFYQIYFEGDTLFSLNMSASYYSTQIPVEIFEFKKLKMLTVSGFGISINPKFRRLNNLTDLTIVSCKIDNIENLDSIKSMENLTLSGNIYTRDSLTLSLPDSIQTLRLNGTWFNLKFLKIKDPDKLRKLETISLIKNYGLNVDSSVFMVPNLKTLSFVYNAKLQPITKYLKYCNKLTKLTINKKYIPDKMYEILGNRGVKIDTNVREWEIDRLPSGTRFIWE